MEILRRTSPPIRIVLRSPGGGNAAGRLETVRRGQVGRGRALAWDFMVAPARAPPSCSGSGG